MKTNVVIVGLVLGVAALASGCTPVIQSGLPDPQLSARDKQMMALAEPDEWTIPTHRSIVHLECQCHYFIRLRECDQPQFRQRCPIVE